MAEKTYEVLMNLKANGKDFKIGDKVKSSDLGKGEKRLLEIGTIKEVKAKSTKPDKKEEKKETKKEAK